LRIQGSLVLEGGVFDAPSGGLTLTDYFTHTGGTYRQTQAVNGSTDVGFPKARGVIVNANSRNLDSTQVIIRAGAECTSVSGEAVRHCYNITPTNSSGVNATITFYFNSSEIPAGSACDTLNAFRWNGFDWDSPLTLDVTYGSGGHNCAPDPESVRVTNVNSFSPFVLRSGDDAPVAIVLQTLHARSAKGADTILLTFTLLLLAAILVGTTIAASRNSAPITRSRF